MSAVPWITISVFTENHVGLLQRVTSIFTRRSVNIESLTVSQSEIPGIHRFTIAVALPRDRAEKIALQLERQVEVIKAFVHEDHQVIHRDIALYKLPASARFDPAFHTLVRTREARVLEENELFVVLEKTGTQDDTAAFFNALAPWGVLEFVRSGRVAMTRPMKTLHEVLHEMQAAQAATGTIPQELSDESESTPTR
jgi:acetolactate synthase-1/3 small subunit